MLEASAFANADGSTVSFLETAAAIKSVPPGLRRMHIGRPAGVSVAIPPRSASLGFVRFQVGWGSDGARVVLTTRPGSAFVAITFSSEARTIRVSLAGRGARLLNFRGCTTQTFDARFETSSGQVFRDDARLVRSSLRRAGLC